MRRFELSDGTSNKFWQVAVEDGETLCVTFGKIGSAGKTQRTEFASEAAATAAMEKLIREKTKKGYGEKGAPAPEAPKPTGDRVVWTPEAKKILDETHEHRRRYRPQGLPSLIVDRMKADVPRWAKAEEKWEPGLSAVRARLEEAFTREPLPATVDPELEAAGATLAGYEDAPKRAWVARWLGIGGPTLALEVLSRMWAFRREYAYSDDRDAQPTWLMAVNPETNWDSSTCGAKRFAASSLREHFRTLPPAEQALMRARAVELREGASLPVRIGLATAVNDAALANEDAAEVIALPRNPHGDAKELLTLVDDVAMLEALVARYGVGFWPELFVEQIGLAAVGVVAKHLTEQGSRDYEVKSATILATLECAETAKVFGGYLHKKGVDAIAREFFTRRPDLALPVLRAIVAGKGKNALFAASLLKKLDAPSAVVIPAKPEADRAELPQILVEPPWTVAKPAKPPPVVEDVVIPFGPDRIDEELAKAHASPVVPGAAVKSWYATTGKMEPGSDLMNGEAKRQLASYGRFLGSWIELMSDDAAKELVTGGADVDMSVASVDPGDLRYLLVRFGLPALPFVLAVAKSNGAVAAEALLIVESPRAAIAIADAAARARKARPAAARYYDKYPAASAHGLLAAALAKKTQKTHAPAVKALAVTHGDAVRAAAAKDARVAGALDAILAWEGPPPKIPAVPAWLDPKTLPPVLLRSADRQLPLSAVGHLLTLLMLSDPRDPHARLGEVVAACTPESLSRFAWALFEAWLAGGGNASDDWAMTALGHLGGDDAARRLTPFIRSWPGEAAHARAVKGLDVLAEIGSDRALMHLDSIAEKLKFKGLQEKAREKIEEIAEARGLTRDELADRIAPTLDLDADGSRVLSFGARSFRVGFDEHLVPFVVDDAKKRAADLPKPKASDDSAVAAESVATWKALKKDAKAVASSQVMRLERAMCMGRQWSDSDFTKLLLNHPLVVHVVRRLLWATYAGDTVTKLFRVAEDRTLADVNEDPFTLPTGAVVGIPHRLALADADLRGWGEVFGSYEIIQPFAQLDREIFAMTDKERAAKELERMKGVAVPTRKVLGLEGRGWRKGMAQDAGWIWDVEKELPGGLRATLALDGGLLAGAMAESPEEQTLGAVVVEGKHGPVALGELRGLIFSELVRDLEGLRDSS